MSKPLKYDNIWYVIHQERDGSLAYMCHYQDDKAFEKRKATGTSWARDFYESPEPEGKIIENNPEVGFKIIDWASRWSTDNKLVRVEDPRGFTLEISVANLITIIKNCTIIDGEIENPLVWCREGQNNVLIPASKKDLYEDFKPLDKSLMKDWKKNLEVGDTFLGSYGHKYAYMGEYEVEVKYDAYLYEWNHRSICERTITKTEVVKKKQKLFARKECSCGIAYFRGSNFKPKAILEEKTAIEDMEELLDKDHYDLEASNFKVPESILDAVENGRNRYWKSEVVSISELPTTSPIKA